MSTAPQLRLLESARVVLACVGDADPAASIAGLGDDELLRMLGDIAEGHQALQVLGALASAEVARRSERELGYMGLAQRKGHRTGTDLIQAVTGQTRADVRRATAAGQDLTAGEEQAPSIGTPPLHDVTGDGIPPQDGTAPGEGADGPVPPDAGPGTSLPAGAPRPRWFSPLADALREGDLSREQYDVIRRGLGEPPVERYPDLAPGVLLGAWCEAARVLVLEAREQTVESLAGAARLARDTLDPIGVQLRFDERFERRSFRAWIDADGQHHARIAFDDDAAVWVHTILNAALRPRRGPRFVETPESDGDVRRGGAASGSGSARTGGDGVASDGLESAGSNASAGRAPEDARTNEQLQYDTLIAILRTGAAADPAQAFGDRQPGVRVLVAQESLQNRDGFGRPIATAYAEETQQTLPGAIAERYRCDAGVKPITLAVDGTPLDVGREQRLFTTRQRDAMAVRDGGCRWCGVEPSRCEAHHIVHWAEHDGRTDLADGVLLCRNCHMRLHNQAWLITRTGTAYWLHPPDRSSPRLLRSRSLLRFRDTG